MVEFTQQQLRRRTLVPVDRHDLLEATVMRRGNGHDLRIELAGGPPHTTVDVYLDDQLAQSLLLDGLGSGAVMAPSCQDNGTIAVRVGSCTVLQGRVPSGGQAGPVGR